MNDPERKASSFQSIVLPSSVLKIIGDLPYTQEDIGMSGAKILLFEDVVLKIRREGGWDTADTLILQFLSPKLPVPKVLAHEVENGWDYLLMSRIKGRMLCDPEVMQRPSLLLECMAQALHLLWSVPAGDVPFDRTLENELAHARSAIESGTFDASGCDPATFGPHGFSSPAALLHYLEKNRPHQDLVLTHGDFCLPNLFTDGQKLSGMIDLGDCGVADRYKDLSLGWRSLKHNSDGHYGPVYPAIDPDDLFIAAGVPKDEEKLQYYLLLSELF